MILIGGVWSSIRAAAVQLLIMIEAGIYNVAAYAFKVFLILSEGTIIDSDTYGSLLKNVYLIIGVVLLFVIAFALLQGIVNPDNQKTGTSSMGKMVVNFVTSLIIIVLLPTIFTFLYDVQSAVISYNTIGTFFGYGGTEQATTVETASRKIVNAVWTAFFNVTEEYANSSEGNGCSLDNNSSNSCQEQITADDDNITLKDVINDVDSGYSFNKYGQFANTIIDGDIDFNVIICLVAGLLLIYVGVSYCFDMALRLVKLIFFQLIAPVPILLRIIPGDKWGGTFNTWLKKTLSCYFEVYVRIIVLYLCVYVCNLVINSSWLSSTLTSYGGVTWLLTRAFLLMGIVMFMRQAPKLLSEVTGIESGDMKLGIRDKLKEGGAFAVGAVAGGALTAGVRNMEKTGANIHDRWKRDVAAGDKHRVLHALGGAAKMIPSGVAGFASGGAHSVPAASKASNSKEMKEAAGSGARVAIDKKAKRDSYTASHRKNIPVIGGLVGSGLGHIDDAFSSAGHWITDTSIDGLTTQSQANQQLIDASSGYSDSLENMILKQQSKGGGIFTELDSSGNNAAGLDSVTTGLYSTFKAQDDAYQQALYAFQANPTATNAQQNLDAAKANRQQALDSLKDHIGDRFALGDKDGKLKAGLSQKANAELAESVVAARRLETVTVANANSNAVQTTSKVALDKIMKGKDVSINDFKTSAGKLKDVASNDKGKIDTRIAELNTENAAKGGDKK